MEVIVERFKNRFKIDAQIKYVFERLSDRFLDQFSMIFRLFLTTFWAHFYHKLKSENHWKNTVFFSMNLAFGAFSKASKFKQKSIKNQSKMWLYFWSDFWSIFDRFLIDFGSQNPSKINPKTMPKHTLFWIAFFIASGSIFEGFWGGPRGVLERTFGQLFGSWGHLGAKMAPRPLQEASRIDFGQILYDFFLHFEWFFGDLGNISYYFWTSNQSGNECINPSINQLINPTISQSIN